MADQKKDTPEAKEADGLYNKTLGRRSQDGRTFAGLSATASLHNFFCAGSKGNEPFILLFAMLGGVATMGATFVLESGEEVFWSPEQSGLSAIYDAQQTGDLLPDYRRNYRGEDIHLVRQDDGSLHFYLDGVRHLFENEAIPQQEPHKVEPYKVSSWPSAEYFMDRYDMQDYPILNLDDIDGLYISISPDNSATVYTAIIEDGTWRLYENERLIETQQNAWQTLQEIVDDIERANTILASNDTPSSLPTAITFDSISNSYFYNHSMDGPRDGIKRVFEGQSEHQLIGVPLDVQMDSMYAIWNGIAHAVRDGQYGLSPEKQAQVEEAEIFFGADAWDKALIIGGGLVSLYTALSLQSGMSHAWQNTAPTSTAYRRRKREEKARKKENRP